MPVYNYECDSKGCELEGKVLEHRTSMSQVDNPVGCPSCNGNLRRVITGANVIWARPLSFYHDKRLEGASNDYHIAKKKTEAGTQEVRLHSVADIRRYCKEENLTDPMDLNPNAMPSSDGTKIATAGVSGQWI